MLTKVVNGIRMEMTPEEIRQREIQEQEYAKEKESRKPNRIKKEASRRILEIAPEWKQRNLISSGVEMLDKLVQGGSLSTADLAARNYSLSIWSQIAKIRAKSNELEAMDPIPNDFKDDKYWI